MILARTLPQPQAHLKLVEPEENTKLTKRLNTPHLEDRIDWMRIHVAEKVPYIEGRCNLRTYERINKCYDLIEEIETVLMRRLYQEHGASIGRVSELQLYDPTNIFINKVENSKEGLTACLVLQGTQTLEYINNGMHVPVELTKGDIFIWNSSVSVGFDKLNDSRIGIFGIK